jgi:hypothetical protein
MCGAYLDPAWREGAYARDSSKSFLFTLKNHAGVVPTYFPMVGDIAAFLQRDVGWCFGFWEGPYIKCCGPPGRSGVGRCYEDVVGQGQAIFNGGQDFFRMARWELWQIA